MANNPNLFQRVIGRLASALDAPRYISKEEMLEQIYSRPQTEIQRGGWEVRVSDLLDIKWFIVRCTCDVEFPFADAIEACADHQCPSCKEKLPNLLKFVGIDPKETPVQQWAGIFLSKLPRRPFNVDQRRAAGPIKFGDWDSNLPNDNVAAPLGSDGSWV